MRKRRGLPMKHRNAHGLLEMARSEPRFMRIIARLSCERSNLWEGCIMERRLYPVLLRNLAALIPACIVGNTSDGLYKLYDEQEASGSLMKPPFVLHQSNSVQWEAAQSDIFGMVVENTRRCSCLRFTTQINAWPRAEHVCCEAISSIDPP